VIDLECGNNLMVTLGETGLERKKVAHYVGGWSSSSAQLEEEDGGSEKKADEEECGLKDGIRHSYMEHESSLGDSGLRASGVKCQAILNDSNAIDPVLETGSSSNKKESKGEQYAFGRATLGASSTSLPFGDGGGKKRSNSNSLPRRRKKKGLVEMGEPRSHPRQSARLSERRSQAGTSSFLRASLSVVSISNRDIMNCNSRLGARSNIVESPELWAIGKQLGCCAEKMKRRLLKNMTVWKQETRRWQLDIRKGKRIVFYDNCDL